MVGRSMKCVSTYRRRVGGDSLLRSDQGMMLSFCDPFSSFSFSSTSSPLPTQPLPLRVEKDDTTVGISNVMDRRMRGDRTIERSPERGWLLPLSPFSPPFIFKPSGVPVGRSGKQNRLEFPRPPIKRCGSQPSPTSRSTSWRGLHFFFSPPPSFFSHLPVPPQAFFEVA